MEFFLSRTHALLLALVYAIAFINALRIMRRRQHPSTTTAWILCHILLPFLAVPLYFLFGENRIRGFNRQRRARAMEFAAYAGNRALNPNARDTLLQMLHPSETRFITFARVFERLGDVFSPQMNRAKLLINGQETFDEIFSALEKAEHYILVQYYILRADLLGHKLQEVLIRKAKQGVRVYLLIDDMGSFALSKQYMQELKDAGVEIARFLPVTSFSRFFQINFRNHRKIVVIDGACAFTGGLNIGDEYNGRGGSSRYWRDTHLRIVGPAARQLADVFVDDWFFAAEKAIDLTIRTANKDPLDPTIIYPRFTHAQDNTSERKAIAQVIPSGPTDPEEVAAMMYLNAINSAVHRLWIATPYFVPDETLMNALILAKRRGVDVQILLPARGDHRVVHWVGISFAEDLCRRGIGVKVYKKGFMHSKITLVDDHLTLIGSCNLDNRALYLNFECTVAIYGEDFCAGTRTMFEDDFRHTRELVPRSNTSLFKFREIITDAGRLVAPLL